MRLYDALIISTLLSCAEMWPTTVANMKRLGSSSPQIAKKNTRHLVEKESYKRRSQMTYGTRNIGEYHKMFEITVALASYGGQSTAKAGSGKVPVIGKEAKRMSM